MRRSSIKLGILPVEARQPARSHEKRGKIDLMILKSTVSLILLTLDCQRAEGVSTVGDALLFFQGLAFGSSCPSQRSIRPLVDLLQ